MKVSVKSFSLRSYHLFLQAASPVLKPMMDAGHRLSERLQLNKRVNALSESLHLETMNNYISRTVDSEALPVVAGVGAITAIGEFPVEKV